MNSRFFRTQLSLIPIVLVIEFALCSVVAYAIYGSNFEISYAFIALVILYVVRIVIVIVNTITATVLYYVTKKDRIKTIVSMLYRAKVPVTEELRFCDDILSEFARLALKVDTPTEARQFLLLTIAEINVMRSSSKQLAVLQALAVIDQAIQQYIAEHDAKRL